LNLTQKTVERILKQVEGRRLSSRRAFEKLKNLPYETLSCARIDHHRSFRKGFPEAVYAPGKTLKQLEKIITSIRNSGHNLIVTRLEKKIYSALRKKFPLLRYSDDARIAYWPSVGARSVNGATKQSTNGIASAALRPRNDGRDTVAILTGGTSDLPVAEEAALTLELIGKHVIRLYDCGVAGLHRLLDQLPRLKEVRAIVCVAGMEGALASVVAGLVDKPVIAVPTSVGYGASFKGIAPLLTMLNSCAQGIAVVNIDNGFGAACFAASVTS
jgi:NCAIR mutase (PurE)-related protein